MSTEERKVYLCMNRDREAVGEGNSLKDAYDDYVDITSSDERPEDLDFYEAVKVEVEVKIQRKEVVTKITAKK